MVLFDEYSTEKLDNALNTLNKYFYLMDKDFFLDLERLRDEITDEYSKLDDDKSLQIEGELARVEIPLNESVRIASEVFGSVNPKYKEMFLMLIKDPKYKIQYIDGPQTSLSDDIYLTGTIEDVIILVHEFAHNFVVKEDDCFFLNLFGEVNAMFWEKVAVDYLASEYNTIVSFDRFRLTELMKNRTRGLNTLYLKLLDKSKKGIDKEGFFEVYEESNIPTRFFLDSDLLLSPFGTQLFLFGNYYHALGFLLANSIYQDYLDNPECISKLYDVEKVNSFSDDLLKEGLSILFEDDIPIINDGRVSLKGDNYSRLLSSLHETMKRERVKQVVE